MNSCIVLVKIDLLLRKLPFQRLVREIAQGKHLSMIGRLMLMVG
jgi:histone H3/H4